MSLLQHLLQSSKASKKYTDFLLVTVKHISRAMNQSPFGIWETLQVAKRPWFLPVKSNTCLFPNLKVFQSKICLIMLVNGLLWWDAFLLIKRSKSFHGNILPMLYSPNVVSNSLSGSIEESNKETIRSKRNKICW